MHRLTSFSIAALIALSVLVPSFAGAAPRVAGSAPLQAGFPVTVPGGLVDRQSPVIADIRPDIPGLEIAIATKDGTLSLVSSAGQVLWNTFVPPSSCANNDRLNSNPAVGKLYGGDVEYVVIGYGNIYPKNNSLACPGGVAAFDARSGSLVWRLQTDVQSPSENLRGVYSTPALADADGDGTLEVAFGAFDRYFYLLDHTGQLIWRYQAGDTVWSSPAFADVNGDGRLDVVFGTDIAAGSPGIVNGGFVYAFKTTPSTRANHTIPFNTNPANIENLIWRSPNYDQSVYSAPALADLDGDGTLDVIFSSSCFYPTASTAKNGRWIKILNSRTGAEERTITMPNCSASSPAIGDLDGDGKLDIAINMTGDPANGGNGQCNTLAWKGDGTFLWAATPQAGGISDIGCDVLQAPVIADVDGNGSLEVLTTDAIGVVVLDGRTGAQLSDNSPPTMSTGGRLSHGTPAIGDLDGNGTLEVTLGAGDQLFAWTNLSQAISSSANATQPAFAAPWPMFRGNPQRSGVMSVQPALQLPLDSLGVLVGAQSGAQLRTLVFQNVADGVLSWSATADQSWIRLDKASGATPGTLGITIDPAVLGNRPGVYTGAVTVSSSSPIVIKSPSSSVVLAASHTITVRLTIVDSVSPAYLAIVKH